MKNKTKNIMAGIGLAVVLAWVVGIGSSNAASNRYTYDPAKLPSGDVVYSIARATSTNEQLICSGECVVHAILITSGAAAAYLVIRDTSVANGNGTQLFNNIVIDTTTPYPIDVLKGNKIKSTPGYGITADWSSMAANEAAMIYYTKIGD